MESINKFFDKCKAILAKLISDAKAAPDHTAEYDQNDIKANTLMALCCYVSWLVLIPYFLSKESRYTRFHVNQGLVLAIVESICFVALTVLGGIPLIGIVFRIINTIAKIFFFCVSCYGVFTVVNGKAKEIPIIGNVRIAK